MTPPSSRPSSPPDEVAPARGAGVLGYPLFGAGALALVAGLALHSFWPMMLGMIAMAYGALRFTERW